MGKVIGLLVLALMVLGLLPFALIARSRSIQSDNLPLHLILDMDKQSKFKAQRATPMFADQRAMRPQVHGTVAREDMIIKGELLNDPANPRLIALTGGNNLWVSDAGVFSAVMLGRVRSADMTDEKFDALTPPNKDDAAIAGDTTFYVRTIPAQFNVSAEFLKRGQERFNIYCSPCHGESGYGDGMVAKHADDLAVVADGVSGWAKPQNLHEKKIEERPDGHIFNTITNGVRNMPAYDKQISIPDRWAIVAYVRALQVSQNAPTAAAK